MSAISLSTTFSFAFFALLLFSCSSLAKNSHHRHRKDHRNPCPNGWTEYDGSCYKHLARALNWQDAVANCDALDAHLVIINSEEEASWLCSYLNSQLSSQHRNLCRSWWTAGGSEDGNWIWHQTQSVYEIVIRSNRWFGGRPDADRLDNYRVTMQLANGYFGLIAREPSVHLPSVCESDIEESESQDSDSSSSHGHHSRGRHSRGSGSSDSDHSQGHHSSGRHSRGSGSSDSDHSQGHHSSGRHSRGSGSSDSDHSHGHHSRGRHSRGSGSSDSDHSHGHHSRGRHSRGSGSSDSDRSHGHRHHHGGPGRGRGHYHRGRPGHIHGQYHQYRQNPYSPYYPRPRLPYNCEQPTTPAPSTRWPTTQFTTTRTESTTSTTTPTTVKPTTFSTRRPTTKQTTISATEELTTEVPSTEIPEPCPPGWLSYSSSCYQIHNSCAQTHYTARTACELLGGHLVTINTPEEEAFLTSKLDKRKEYWTSARYEYGYWSWEDDSDSSSSSGDNDYEGYEYSLAIYSSQSDGEYTNWHQNEPRKEEDGVFVVLSWSRGRWGWRSRLGNDYKHYICEVKRDEVQNSCLTQSCQYNIEGIKELNDWEKFLDNDYLVHDSCAKTQFDAEATCRQKGGRLLSIKSSDEMRFVQGLLRARSYDREDGPNWWTSGTKAQGRWQWQGSNKRMIYTNWGPNANIPRGNSMILHYYPRYDDWMWTDTAQSQVSPFICKRTTQQ